MKRVALLGATGSIGRQAIEIVQSHPELELVAAASGSQPASGSPAASGRPPARYSASELPALPAGLRDHRHMPDSRTLMTVHAHPDDETIATGGIMSKYSRAGDRVICVTCTGGEHGEIVVPDLDTPENHGKLAEIRREELRRALEQLGPIEQRWLGYVDSGMMGTPENSAPESFWQADVDEAAHELVAVIREVRPQVMVTYDDNGFYGHPDHIQAHRVAWRAFQLAADPAILLGAAGAGPWRVTKFYATAMPRSRLAEAIKLRSAGYSASPAGFTEVSSVDELPFGVADDQVTTEIDGTRYLDAKLAAMRAHATQIAVDGPFFALSDMVGQRVSGYECYTLLAGERVAAAGSQGRADDLFAGL